MECRCDDVSLIEMRGDEALDYRRHLTRVSQQSGSQAWLMRCPTTGQEWVEDAPIDTGGTGMVGLTRLRRFPEAWNRPRGD